MTAQITEDRWLADDVDFVHTGPGTLAGRYLREFWQPVYRSEALPAGRATPIHVMGEAFTLYRGETGVAHVVAFRCAHRGTQLSVGWVKGDNLRCFYHGWMYDASGQCVEQPAEPEPFCQRIRIRSYPVQEYLGLIFVYLGEGEPPPFPRYVQAEQPGLVDTWGAIVPCNYFNALENDPVHTYFVHRRPGHDWHDWNGAVPIVSAEEDEFGVRESTRYPGGGIGVLEKGMPNIVIRQGSVNVGELGGGSSTAIVWKVPIDDESHLRIGLDAIHITGDAQRQYVERRDAARARMDLNPTEMAERVLDGRMRMDDIDPARVYIVNVQDDVAQAAQGRIADRNEEHLGRSDVGVVLLRKIWVRELRALAAGQPIKRWLPLSDLHTPDRGRG